MTSQNRYTVRKYNTDLQCVESFEVSSKQGTKEYYYSPEFYDPDMTRFVAQVQGYFAGKRTVPVSKTSSISSECLFFTFSDDLYSLFITQLDRIKPYECALKYGLRGYSKGGKNGVFLLRKKDETLFLTIEQLVQKYQKVIL